MKVFQYQIDSGYTVLARGALTAETGDNALAQVFKKIHRGTNGIKITMNGEVVYTESKKDPGTMLFAKPIAKKVDNRVKW